MAKLLGRRFKRYLIDVFLIEARRGNVHGESVFFMVVCFFCTLYESGCCWQSIVGRKREKNKEANDIGGERVISNDNKFNSADCIRRWGMKGEQ